MVPSELQDLVKARNPFNVIDMKATDFSDITNHADTFLSTNKLNISKASIIKVESANPTRIKTTFNELVEFEEIKTLNKGQKVSKIKSLKLKELSAQNKISQGKKNDWQC